MNNEHHRKVTARHLARGAYLYVRQSTMRQVIENTESTERQYALRQRAIALGWKADSVVVIDSDLGHSAASAADREGFQKLVAEVGMGRAGIVLGLEVSRLARNSTDWHRLLEICAVTETLILDEDGIYDPTNFNDRLLLGLKGTMSEAELHVLRARMRGGLINKAKRGELRFQLPTGFVLDGAGRVVIDPDKHVQESIRLLFDTFERTGAAHATVKVFRDQGLLFPTRLDRGPKKGELTWSPLYLGRTATILHNPWYAGAYAFGRARHRKQPDGKVRRELLPPAEWIALIRDAHPGYISWEQFEQNEQRLRIATNAMHFRSPPREGTALLQGRAVCGLCGARMHIRYGARGEQRITNYVCVGRGKLFGDPLCQSIVGTRIDDAIGKLVADAVTPMALEMTLAVQEELERRAQQADGLRYRQVERAQYEADLARQRFMRVDPANRLVADSLETDWNAKLRTLDQARDDYERQRRDGRPAVDEEQRRRILALATDFPLVWNDPNTPARERKRMLALLIEDVTIIKQRELTVSVRFRAGTTTTLTLPRPLSAAQLRATDPKVRQHIDTLLDEYTDDQVAHILNQRGLRTGSGEPFDAVSVQWIRVSAKLPSLKDRLRAAGMLTAKELSDSLGVKRTTISRWRVQGLIEARICNGRGQWLYWPPKQIPPHRKAPNHRPAKATAGRTPVRGAV